MNEEIKKCVDILREGGIIVYPTDTIWGIGCDATNRDAVERIYTIKERDPAKSMLILVDQPGRIPGYVREVPDIAWELLEVNPEPMTLIYPGAKNLAENLPAEDGSIGIRVTEDLFCSRLVSRLGKPIVSTSANFSGAPAPALFDEIDEELLGRADYVADWRREEQVTRKPSSVISVGPGGRIQVLRQ